MAHNPIIITGTPQSNSWSQAYTYSFGSTRILLLLSLSQTQTNALDLAMYGNKLAEDIYHQLTLNLSPNLPNLKTLVQTFLDPTPSPLNLSLSLALIKNNHLKFVSLGQTQLALLRHSQLTPLLTHPQKLTGLSGQLQPKDTLFISTTKLYQLLTPRLPSLLKNKDLADTLNRLVHSQTDSSQLSGIVYFSPLPHPSFLPSFLPKLPSLPLKQPPLKIKLNQPPSPKNRLFALLLLSFLILSLVVGFFKRRHLTRQRQFNQLTQTIQTNLTNISNLAPTQPKKALDLLHQSQTLISDYLNTQPNSPFKPQVKTLQTQLAQLKTNLFHFTPVSPQTFIDLQTLTSTALLHLASDPDNHLLNLTFTNQKSVILNLTDKSTLPLDLPFPTSSSYLWNQNLYLLTPTKVIRFSLKTRQPQTIIEADDNWQTPSFIRLYAGNIYILDKGVSEIWKYPILNTGYGKRRRWLAPGITLDLSKVIDFQVDGQVWLLTSSGKLQSFLRGAPTSFKLNGFVSRLTNPKDFYLTETEIFILEPDQARILVFSKETGQYLRQYQSDQFKSAQQIFIDQNWLYFTHDHFLSRFPLK